MTHRNTPNQDIGLCPSEMFFGYKIRDHLPNKFRSLRREWTEVQRAREIRTSRKDEILETGKTLQPLQKGDIVSIQNQTGNRPAKWNNTGTIVEVRPHRQYRVMIDGSSSVTLRNRRFLRRIAATTRGNQHPPVVRRNIPLLQYEHLQPPVSPLSQPTTRTTRPLPSARDTYNMDPIVQEFQEPHR